MSDSEEDNNRRISSRESEYQKRRLDRTLSPSRGDAFGDQTPQRGYRDVLQQQELDKEERRIRGELKGSNGASIAPKRRRWDSEGAETPQVSQWDSAPASSEVGSSSAKWNARWDVTPLPVDGLSRWDATPGSTATSRWDAVSGGGGEVSVKKKSRWDETPLPNSSNISVLSTPAATPNSSSAFLATPLSATPLLSAMTPEVAQQLRWEAE
eukprot:gene29894-36098_t